MPRPDIEMLGLTGVDPHARIEVHGTLARMAATLEYTLTATEHGTKVPNRVLLEPMGMARLVGAVLSTSDKFKLPNLIQNIVDYGISSCS